jgi:hypothetical protein
VVERPTFVLGETNMSEENILVALHPAGVNKNVFTFGCDNFLITADGADVLTKTQQLLFVK